MKIEFITNPGRWQEQLPDMLDDKGVLKLRHAAEYNLMEPQALRIWCHIYARYGLPTIESVEWLRQFIDGREAIEIGSGAGDLAHHLGIRATDNHLQDWPGIASYYDLLGQPRIKYPPWVKEIDALEAVKRYRPQIVVASWVTDRTLNHWGVREEEILETGVTYVFIGNQSTHKDKPILRKRHTCYELPFLRSRSTDRKDMICVWST